jgi:threonine aldolase
MLGGAMRQSGMVAAAALYALDHNVERLADDHVNAKRLAEGLAEIDAIELDPTSVDTNIVIFHTPDAPTFCDRLAKEGVLMGAVGDDVVRAVTHLDVDASGVEAAIEAAARLG